MLITITFGFLFSAQVVNPPVEAFEAYMVMFGLIVIFGLELYTS